ncbi:MAG: RDD family protein [Actinomycetota bacterium]|nr:RDD family protein [Actinomycetota bacterium]
MSERETWPPPKAPAPNGSGDLPRYRQRQAPRPDPTSSAYEVSMFSGDGPTAPFGAPLAGWWQRVGAFVLDWLVLGVPWFIITFAITDVFGHPERVLLSNGTHTTTKTIGAWIWLLYGLSAVISAIYFAYFNGTRAGQTPGNRAPGIAVRDIDTGAPIGWRRGFVRFGVRFVLYLLFVVPGLFNDLFPLWDRRRQTIADKAARSVMVRI